MTKTQKSKENNSDIEYFKKKLGIYEKIIQDSLLILLNYKNLDIITSNELNSCTIVLDTLFNEVLFLYDALNSFETMDKNNLIEKLNNITNNLGNLFKNYGTKNFCDFLYICLNFDYNYKLSDPIENNKLDLIKKFFHPIRYKTITWKSSDRQNVKNTNIPKNRIVEDFTIVEKSKNFECFDLARTSNIFQEKVYGMKISIHDEKERKTYIISGIVDNISYNCIKSNYLKFHFKEIVDTAPKDENFLDTCFKNFLESLTLKEIFIYSSTEIHEKFLGYMNQNILIKQKNISSIVKDFIGGDLFSQRKTLIHLLLKEDDHESQYLAYLLYDLLSNDNNGTIDSTEQTILFDSLPWSSKKYFKNAMKQTIQYTNNLANYDSSKIPLEQQICLLKANDSVKEKAMNKLKEIKSKSDDSGSKARQYLDGLLKIPFGIFKKEEILQIMDTIKSHFGLIIDNLKILKNIDDIPIQKNYTNIEIKNIIKIIKEKYLLNIYSTLIEELSVKIKKDKRDNLIVNICFINNLIKNMKLSYSRLIHSGKKTSFMREQIIDFINHFSTNEEIMKLIFQNKNIDKNLNNEIIRKEVTFIDDKLTYINSYMGNVKKILDGCVYGHTKAKRQIERIIAQWINGEQTGYCFGFEGPPGVGKTTFAKKGLAYCLKDENDVPRPFSFIAIGGQDNGSVLNGHNYTYVGSEWGKFVDIIMKNKCMNPIIFIDELDKVSKTEHGKEIIGILTHLVDQTQNDCFQDKYFNGIDLDLSKVLFIFSYNDPQSIDKILLDRIHRIKFDHLSLDDKLVVTRNHLLPEILQKMGLENMIEFSDDNIIYIIQNYTLEPGIRKFKELLFEIIGEINLTCLQEINNDNLPIKITNEEIKNFYLKERHPVKEKMIPQKSLVGIINGLWANAMGQGGIIPIECKYFPSHTFLDFKLTGMQGDVMKESMNVAKTLAWSLITDEQRASNIKYFEESKLQGLHIHCPEGATPKDGPSAGTAITTCLYSLFSKRKIKNTIAITGEINLQGNVTAIGGLELKILGGIRGGVKEFIFPKENKKDFDEFMEKYSEKSFLKDITFHQLETIHQVFELVFEDN